MTSPELPSVDVRDVGEDYLLDVREPDEWAAGRAPQAVHIPLGEIGARWSEVPTDRPVSVICKAGGRSARAAAFLLAQGVDTRNVNGGMLAWQEAGLPMTSDGGPPTVV